MQYRALPFFVFSAAVIFLGPVTSRSEDEPHELLSARAAYQKEVEAANRPIRERYQKEVEAANRPIRGRYLFNLEALKKALGSRGDFKAAVAVQNEIEQAKSSIPDPEVAKFAGTWAIKYRDGATRRYSISQTGLVTMEEIEGKPVTPPLQATIQSRKGEFLLEIEPNKLERLKLSGKTLQLDHFFPRSQFDTGKKPFNLGTGTLQKANQ